MPNSTKQNQDSQQDHDEVIQDVHSNLQNDVQLLREPDHEGRNHHTQDLNLIACCLNAINGSTGDNDEGIIPGARYINEALGTVSSDSSFFETLFLDEDEDDDVDNAFLQEQLQSSHSFPATRDSSTATSLKSFPLPFMSGMWEDDINGESQSPEEEDDHRRGIRRNCLDEFISDLPIFFETIAPSPSFPFQANQAPTIEDREDRVPRRISFCLPSRNLSPNIVSPMPWERNEGA